MKPGQAKTGLIVVSLANSGGFSRTRMGRGVAVTEEAPSSKAALEVASLIDELVDRIG